MPSLAISLAQSLAQSLGSSVGNGDWEFSNFTIFANASERYVINPETGVITGPFASGIPAVIWIDGKRFLQVEASDQCVPIYNTDLTDASWTPVDSDSVESATDPQGNTNASKFIPSTLNRRHYLSQTVTYRTVTIIAKADGYDFAYLRPEVGSTTDVYLSLTDGAITGSDLTAISFSESISLPNDWWLFRIVYNSNSSKFRIGAKPTNSTDYFNGDGSSGVIFWLPQGTTNTGYGTSLIETEASAVTRAKDQVYIPALSVPWFIKDKSKWLWYPKYSNSQIAAGEKRYICRFEDSGSNSVGVYYFGTDQKIYLEVDGVDSFSTGATTHSVNQELEVTLDREAGSITLANFTTGNGETVGTPWNRTDGDLKIGQDSSEANQIDGVIRLEKTT